MDLYVEVFPGAAASRFPLRPSEYINRNVRVSPFSFEPVHRYFLDDPDLSDVFCYSSDYPHVEGGKWSMKKVREKLAGLDEEISDKYFRKNAEWLLA